MEPNEAYFDTDLGEFVLPYQTVRLASDPDETLARFLHSTYGAVADVGGWPRDALEMPAHEAPPWTALVD